MLYLIPNSSVQPSRMSVRCATCLRPAIAAAVVVAAACVRPGLSRSSIAAPPGNGRVSGAPVELLLDADLRSGSCSAGESRDSITGFARMKVRDAADASSASELEYELYVENPRRLRLAGATLQMDGVGAPAASPVANGTTPGSLQHQQVVLWAGETSDKPRLRMRGIVALPRGVSTRELSAALRERRGTLQIRIADQSGGAAGCGDLRN